MVKEHIWQIRGPRFKSSNFYVKRIFTANSEEKTKMDKQWIKRLKKLLYRGISGLFFVLFDQFYKIRTIGSAGFELGSVEKKANMLTFWPQPCPQKITSYPLRKGTMWVQIIDIWTEKFIARTGNWQNELKSKKLLCQHQCFSYKIRWEQPI